ncbi:transposase [Psychrobacillus sp. AK 1817]|uniref:ribonuclease YeeF family protein n=1 Tax=Psychrobacillus sp. AK 1817 TaxID=2303505 RepID=UPI0012471B01|nr:LXG domain-containing protein [Psychrobacillus sp. AK 1817]QEY20576.1 transposase [Psychrobacillus sp. AK 1817]
MKVLDVDLLQTGIKSNLDMLTRLEEEIKEIEKTITGLVGMDSSLKGQGGEAIRSYYNDCHLPFLKFFLQFKQNFKTKLDQLKSALDSLEPDTEGYIQESFLLNEVEEGLAEISRITGNLTDESNAIMDQVSDIVALPHLDDSDVQQGVIDSRKKKDDTVTDLNEFDSTQVSSMLSVESNIKTMDTWLQEMEGMMSSGLSDIHFPAEAWAQYTACTPILSNLSSSVNDPGSVAEKDASESTGDVSKDGNFSEYVGHYGNASTIITDTKSGIHMYNATKNGQLSTSRHFVHEYGKTSYRINASATAMGKLGFPNESGGMLKYAGKKPGQSGWSAKGEMVLEKHPHLRYWGDSATFGEKVKTVGSATFKGAGTGFTDLVDFKEVTQNGVAKGLLKGATKGVAPLTAALSFNDNYNTAKDDGLSGGEAVARATADTAADVAIGSAIQVGLTAAGTAFIPIPGLGTFVGAIAGVGVNMLLNAKGDDGKSALDKLKGWFH